MAYISSVLVPPVVVDQENIFIRWGARDKGVFRVVHHHVKHQHEQSLDKFWKVEGQRPKLPISYQGQISSNAVIRAADRLIGKA